MSVSTKTELYEQYKEAVAAETPVALATMVKGDHLGAKLLVLPDRVEGTLGDPRLDEEATNDARELLAAEKSGTRSYLSPHREDQVEVFIETVSRPPTLLIFGAVHVAQALTRFAKLLGFKVIVSDARAKLATAERFPEADRIIQAWPDDALHELTVEPNTYVAILTHDPKFDEPALLGTLETQARYIGAVGSRKTNRDRRQRLMDAGLDAASLERIRGPIGLDIGAETPEEMAISILAEIIAVRHGRRGGPLTDATGNIRGESQDVAAES
jgi:xanthine dehydrogenase accessory factor